MNEHDRFWKKLKEDFLVDPIQSENDAIGRMHVVALWVVGLVGAAFVALIIASVVDRL